MRKNVTRKYKKNATRQDNNINTRLIPAAGGSYKINTWSHTTVDIQYSILNTTHTLITTTTTTTK